VRFPAKWITTEVPVIRSESLLDQRRRRTAMHPTLSPRAASDPLRLRDRLDKHTREGAAHPEEHNQPERSD